MTVLQAIATGNGHSCAVRSDGNAKCWGWNEWGQIGNGETGGDVHAPANVVGFEPFVYIDAGKDWTCGVETKGVARCWGWNAFGFLGEGSLSNRNKPTKVSGIDNALRVDGGGSSTCALLADGRIRCWGIGAKGQLGDGSSGAGTIATSPVEVSGITSATDVCVGAAHACAVLSDGSAWCWGENGNGQLGDDKKGTDRATPEPVLKLDGAVDVSCGGDTTCAVLSDGTARCWGSGSRGKLGNGGTASQDKPVPVKGIGNAIAIDVGSAHACAILSTKSVACWGGNFEGQIGDGTLSDRDEPVMITKIGGRVVGISAGDRHTCATLEGGTVECWGENAHGKLGDGTTDDRKAPTPVEGL